MTPKLKSTNISCISCKGDLEPNFISTIFPFTLGALVWWLSVVWDREVSTSEVSNIIWVWEEYIIGSIEFVLHFESIIGGSL